MIGISPYPKQFTGDCSEKGKPESLFSRILLDAVENLSKDRRDSLSGALPVPLADSQSCNNWYAIQTRYRRERQVTRSLDRKGLETYIPLLAETHRWSDRQKSLHVPLFDGYTFARLELSSQLKKVVLQTEGVVGFVASGSEIIPIPSRQLEDLQMLLSQKVPCALAPFLQVGQRVRLRGGCLDGLEGMLAQNDAKRLVVSLPAVQRSVTIQIDGYDLELI